MSSSGCLIIFDISFLGKRISGNHRFSSSIMYIQYYKKTMIHSMHGLRDSLSYKHRTASNPRFWVMIEVPINEDLYGAMKNNSG